MRRRIFRWQLILPRLLLVIVVLLGGQYVLGRAARWLAVRSAEAVVASEVEVAKARVSLLDRQVVLGEVRLANPCRPAENLLEADRCELDFVVGPLLTKQAIIDRGRVAGLRFGAEARVDTNDRGETKPGPTHHWLLQDADEPACQWLGKLNQRFKQTSEHQFESLERSAALCARWPTECAVLDKRGAELKHGALELQQAADAAEANRLRHAEFFNALPHKVAELQKKSDEFRAEIEELSASLEAERRAIVAVRQRDERLFRNQLRHKPLDSNSLTAYLLREQLAGPLDELMGWLRWTRQVVPAESTASGRHQRGEDILFAGCRPEPNLLIRELQIQGAARLSGQTVELHGLLTDVTDTPSRHAAPIRLRLTGAGSLPLDLQATIDRTGAVARDELLVDCRGIALPELRLGRSDELELWLAPSSGSLSISVAVEGEKVAGDIQLIQKQVRIRPVLQGGLSDLPLAPPLQATLGKVNSVATRVSLQGTLEEPSCTLWSNLGPAVAEAMQRAMRSAGDQHAEAVLADARRAVDERLADVERQFAEERTKLASQLTGMVRQIETISRSQTPRERISAEQLGRRLPETSLFR